MNSYQLVKNTEWKEVEINGENKEIPVDWEISKLESLVKKSITKGTTPTTIGFPFLDKGEVNFFKVEHLKEDKLLPTNIFIDNNCNEKMKRSQLEENDLLFSIAGTIGNVAKVKKADLPANINQAIAIIRFKDIEDLDYTKFYIKNYVEKITKNTLTGVIPNFNLEMLGDIEIPYPNINKSSIASILSAQESIISDIESLISKYESRFQYLSDELLSGRLRVKEVDGEIVLYKNPEDNWKEVEINGEDKEIPNDWVVEKLKNKSKIHSGGTPSKKEGYYDGNIPWITTTDLNFSYVEKTGKNITELGLKNSSAKLIEKDTILLAMYGASIGKLGISSKQSTTNQSIACMIPKKGVEYKFLFLYFLENKEKIANMGCGNGQPNISQEILKELDVYFPNNAEQKLIVIILTQQEELISQQKSFLVKEKQKFDWLLDNLLSGKYLIKE